MRTIPFEAVGRSVSAIGFGCASLGSLIARRNGLRALARAFDAGVTWFDVAPSYGDGNAELILGDFLKGKRASVSVCTKVGIAPPSVSPVASAAKPAVRWLGRALPCARPCIRVLRPAPKSMPLTGSLVTESVVRSLRALRIENVDVLALHEPGLRDVSRDDVLEALHTVVRKGYASTIGIAGAPGVALAAMKLTHTIRVIQIPADALTARVACQSRVSNDARFVTHGVFRRRLLLQLAALIQDNLDARMLLQANGYVDKPAASAAALLLDAALGSNPNGVVLLSMWNEKHMDLNVARALAPPSNRAQMVLKACLGIDARLHAPRGTLKTETRIVPGRGRHD